jgi:hypothetical protein
LSFTFVSPFFQRITVGLDIINALFEDEEVRNKVFEESNKLAKFCVDQHMTLVNNLLPPAMQGNEEGNVFFHVVFPSYSNLFYRRFLT